LTKPVRFEAEASAELRDAALWYESESAGIGERLLSDVDALVTRIAKLPESGARVPGVADDLNVRQILLRRYPYYVAYLELANDIRVLAVAHTSRRPGYWFGRIESLPRGA
jgi:plasmid stabilization system protein ParE